MQKWLDDFKLAIIEEDLDGIVRLLDEFEEKKAKLQDLKQAKNLPEEAENFIAIKKDKLAKKFF